MFIRLGCVLVFAVVGCRGEIDQQIDRLSAAGVTVKQNSAGSHSVTSNISNNWL